MNKLINFFVSTESDEKYVEKPNLNKWQWLVHMLREGSRIEDKDVSTVDDILKLVDECTADEVDVDFLKDIEKLKKKFRKELEKADVVNKNYVVYSWSVEYDWNIAVLISDDEGGGEE